jgi:hypothetical protein
MKYLATFLITVLMLAMIYGGLAYLINPRGDFPTNLFPNLIADVRTEKRHLFQAFGRRHRIEGLILGSSRSMKLNPELFRRATGQAYFNFAISSSHAEEMLMDYDWVRKQNAHPKTVVIGIDLDIVHGDNANSLKNAALVRIRYGMATSRERSLLSRLAEQVNTLQNLYRLSYVKDMIRSIEIKAAPARFSTRVQSFDEDGYEHYVQFEAQRRAGTFNLDERINDYLEVMTADYQMTGLSERRRGDLERLIAEIQRDGGEVILWITPCHPRAVAAVSGKTPFLKRMQELKAYVHELKRRCGADVYDYSDLASFGGTTTGWYDAMHIDETNADRIANLIIANRKQK